MKILMFGRGAISTGCGWALEQAGHDVEFYVRPGRAAQYGDAVRLELVDARRRPWGRRVEQRWPVRLREELAADHDYDLVVLSVPHHRLAEAAEFLAPRVGGATVLVLGNVWAEPEEAVEPLPLDRLAWGFPGFGGAFGADGVLRGVLLPPVVFGTLGAPPTERELVVRQVFRAAGFRPRERQDLRGWLWLHFAVDAGLHAQALRRGALADLVGVPGAFREALRTGRELLPVLEARGIDLRRHRAAVLGLRAPAWLTGSVLAWLVAHFPPARASFRTQWDASAAEPREIVRDAVAEARRWGVAAPRLEAALLGTS
ncbi:ketopantoate reductase family protein [Lentzea chajnantorensis]